MDIPKKKVVQKALGADLPYQEYSKGHNYCHDLFTPLLAKLEAENKTCKEERNAFQTQAGARKRQCFALEQENKKLKEALQGYVDNYDGRVEDYSMEFEWTKKFKQALDRKEGNK